MKGEKVPPHERWGGNPPGRCDPARAAGIRLVSAGVVGYGYAIGWCPSERPGESQAPYLKGAAAKDLNFRGHFQQSGIGAAERLFHAR